MAKVGPNAVIQLGEALSVAGENELARAIYRAAGCTEWLANPPTEMVDEAIVARLFDALTKAATADKAVALFQDAGRRTGQYILQNRIPAVARVLLPLLPQRMALRLLLAAISKHAWTFAGSGAFSYRVEAGRAVLSIANNPLATQLGCPWHSRVFETLFNALLRVPTEIREIKGWKKARVARSLVRAPHRATAEAANVWILMRAA